MKPKHHHFASLLLALSSVPSVAAAQGTDANRAAARALAFEAQAALENKEYAAAAERFTRADALVHAPTLLLGLARADVGLGKLVAAREVYARIVREGVRPGASAVFTRAVDDAKSEMEALDARMPPVQNDVKKPDLPVLVPVAAPEPAAPPRVVPPRALQEAKPAERPSATPSSRRTMFGFVTLGIGGAALATGMVTGILALGRERDLSALCPRTQCPPSERAAVDDYMKLRVVTLSTLITGAMLATTGALVIFTAPKPRPRDAFVRPLIGLGHLGLEGAF